ncbi:GNAT family N-acetyltransferase [Micromonospora sp. WMMD882]|uniref:GNAT family N-acetyltransferase n=1 Tax=Micromonospora sp. WMMD882 TaxID=3015151 RepID=UPI00248D0FD4|nr:GNAT family N-acetyltransferase [Micromonospora sp. WMMD882]WBB80220.1 GNAT family N-acetyltransferase [Micromonospora sp. WMMD882]
MSRLEVRPLTADELAVCGALLAGRHRRHRVAQPLLPPRFEDPATATAELTAAFGTPDASGAVAFRAGVPVGFLLGAPKAAATWGPNVWVEAAGQATTDPEAMRDLYGVAAARWVDEGRTAHYVLVPAPDRELAHAWFRSGFGQQHAHAVRPIPPGPLSAGPSKAASTPPGPSAAASTRQGLSASDGAGRLVVRRADRADVPVLARLDAELPRQHGLSPTFSAGPAQTFEESLADWTEDIDDPGYATFVVERDGEVIGSAFGCSVERSGSHRGLARPENAGLLAFAAVFPHARGVGAGRALGAAVVDWAAGAGFDSVVTDWRVTNLLSSRAWPALGFTETFLRLHRLVGY